MFFHHNMLHFVILHYIYIYFSYGRKKVEIIFIYLF